MMLKSLQAIPDPQVIYGNLRKIAIIDVGSNSFRLIVITYVPQFHFQVTDEVRETVRLVRGLGATGRLSPEGMDRAVEVMRLYRAFCDSQDITDIVAVATSAVREATNQHEFLERVERETGIRVRVLSGEEEAYYGYLAAVNCTTLDDGHVIDLGGGSLQITRVNRRRNHESVSFTFGAVRTTEDWLPDAPASKAAVARLRRHIRHTLEPYTWFKARPGARLIAEGGSLRNAARIVQKAKGYPLDEIQGYVLARDELRRVVRMLEPLRVEERRAIPGMKSDRADITLAGAIVVEECMRFARYDALTVSSQGLREGLFYERFLAENMPPLFNDVRRASVMNIAHLYHYQEKHAHHVAHLALSMFDQLGINDKNERELLWAVCMLHDIGMTIDYNDHHRHSYYLILNSGLPGYSHRELALIALAARYHRKGDPSPDELAGILEKGDEARLLRMTALLRLAEQLDRSRDGSVRDVRLHLDNGRARLEALSDTDILVAVWSAQNHVNVFQAAFGMPLEVVYGR